MKHKITLDGESIGEIDLPPMNEIAKEQLARDISIAVGVSVRVER